MDKINENLEKVAWEYVDVGDWTQRDFDKFNIAIKSTIKEALLESMPSETTKLTPEPVINIQVEAYNKAIRDVKQVIDSLFGGSSDDN